jgi:hypothetical protein
MRIVIEIPDELLTTASAAKRDTGVGTITAAVQSGGAAPDTARATAGQLAAAGVDALPAGAAEQGEAGVALRPAGDGDVLEGGAAPA